MKIHYNTEMSYIKVFNCFVQEVLASIQKVLRPIVIEFRTRQIQNNMILEEYVPIHEVQDITERIIKRIRPYERLIIGIAGRPGSGKTCLANVLAQFILDHTNVATNVTVMPMDGYHLYREELSRMPDPERVFARRGAHWTFNAKKLYSDLVRITAAFRNDDIKVPSFDHSIKDPKEDDIIISKDAQIVLVEGNYLFYTKDPIWCKVNEMLHLKVFLECDSMECTERLAMRHMAAWGISREEAMLRATGSDSKNGDLIDTTKDNADVVCHSIKIHSSTVTPS